LPLRTGRQVSQLALQKLYNVRVCLPAEALA
jgi:hypothetical protein